MTERQSLSALCGGRAAYAREARPLSPFQGEIIVGNRSRGGALARLPRATICHAFSVKNPPVIAGVTERTRSLLASGSDFVNTGSAPLENSNGALPRNHYNPISIASQPAP